MLRKVDGKDGKQDRQNMINVKYIWNGVVFASKTCSENKSGVSGWCSSFNFTYDLELRKACTHCSSSAPYVWYSAPFHIAWISGGAPSYTQQKSESRISVFSRGKLEEHIQPWVAALAPVPLPVCFLTFKKNILRKNHPKSVASGVRSSRGVHAGRAQALKYQGGGHG